ncbi:hypothetical protein HK101_006749, partial [Irineochytrium annulatum]
MRDGEMVIEPLLHTIRHRDFRDSVAYSDISIKEGAVISVVGELVYDRNEENGTRMASIRADGKRAVSIISLATADHPTQSALDAPSDAGTTTKARASGSAMSSAASKGQPPAVVVVKEDGEEAKEDGEEAKEDGEEAPGTNEPTDGEPTAKADDAKPLKDLEIEGLDVSYVTTSEEIKEALGPLTQEYEAAGKKVGVNGLDCEWNYGRDLKPAECQIALIQIAHSRRVVLLHVTKIPYIPPELLTILKSDRVRKVGLNVTADARKIFRDKVELENRPPLEPVKISKRPKKNVDNSKPQKEPKIDMTGTNCFELA